MRIGFDTRPLQTGHRFRGIGAYTYYLLKYLSYIDKENHYFLFLDRNKAIPDLNFLAKDFNQELVLIPGFKENSNISRVLNQQVITSLNILKVKLDIFHFTEFNFPIWQPCKTIVTVHDLIPLRLPQFFPNYSSAYRLRRIALRKTEKIIVDSRRTKNDIVDLLDITEDRIKIIYLGIDEFFRPLGNKESLEKVKKKYSLPDRFILYVGSLEYRKNVLGLVEAFSKVASNYAGDIYLIILTLLSKDYADVINCIRRSSINSKILLLNYMPYIDDLIGLYNAAYLYVSASLYEGFGLPLAEAMACGTPVVCFNNSSHPEIVQGGGILVKNNDTDALAEWICKLFENSKLREELKNKAIERAKLFSWNKTAQETLDLYRKVCQRRDV